MNISANYHEVAMTPEGQIKWHCHDVRNTAGSRTGSMVANPVYKEVIFGAIDDLFSLMNDPKKQIGAGNWSKAFAHELDASLKVALKLSKRADNPPSHIGLPATRALVSLSYGLETLRHREKSATRVHAGTPTNRHLVELLPAEAMLVFTPLEVDQNHGRPFMVNRLVVGQLATVCQLPAPEACKTIMEQALEAIGLNGLGVWHDIYSRSQKPRPQNVVVIDNMVENDKPLLKMVPIDPYAEASLDF